MICKGIQKINKIKMLGCEYEIEAIFIVVSHE